MAKLTIKKLPVDKFNFTFLVDLMTASEIFFYRMFFSFIRDQPCFLLNMFWKHSSHSLWQRIRTSKIIFFKFFKFQLRRGGEHMDEYCELRVEDRGPRNSKFRNCEQIACHLICSHSAKKVLKENLHFCKMWDFSGCKQNIFELSY